MWLPAPPAASIHVMIRRGTTAPHSMTSPISNAARAVCEAVMNAPDHMTCEIAAALRAAAEELRYKLFLPGNDLDVVEARALFKMADELESIQ
jgi:hypothetical protein